MKRIKKIATAVMLFTVFMFSSLSETIAGPVIVTLYGKGGFTNPDGSVTICPEESTQVCAKLEIADIKDILNPQKGSEDPIVKVYLYEEQKTVEMKLSEVINYLKNAIDENEQ